MTTENWLAAGSIEASIVPWQLRGQTASWSLPDTVETAGQEVTVLLHLLLVQPHMELCAQFWAPQFKNNRKVLKCAGPLQPELSHSIQNGTDT